MIAASTVADAVVNKNVRRCMARTLPDQRDVSARVCAELREIQRQQDPQLKTAVELAAAGNVPASLERLQSHLVEIERHQDRHARIAADFAALTPAQRARPP